MESKLSTFLLLPGTQRAVPFLSCICVFAPVAPAPRWFSHTCLSGKYDSYFQVTLLKCPLLYDACLDSSCCLLKTELAFPSSTGKQWEKLNGMISLTYVTLLFSAVSFLNSRSQAFSLCVFPAHTHKLLWHCWTDEWRNARMHDYGIVNIQIAHRTWKEVDRRGHKSRSTRHTLKCLVIIRYEKTRFTFAQYP